MQIICFVLRMGVLAIFAWIILSYVVAFGKIPWGHPVRRLYDGLSKAIDPILRPIRSVLPPVRFGNAALDLSPLVLVLGVTILLRVIC